MSPMLKRIRLTHAWRWYDLIAAALILVSLFQWVSTFRNFGWTWVKRFINFDSGLTAIERSAKNYFWDTGAEYLRFLDAVLPDGVRLVTGATDTPLLDTNILNYFLPDHANVACETSLDQAAYGECLRISDRAVPAMRDFPPPSILEGTKTFIPFDDPKGFYKGVYIPAGSAPPTRPRVYGGSDLYPFPALAIDLAILALTGFLGYRFVRLVIPFSPLFLALGISFPVGAGLLTWAVFLVGWPGLPITLWTFLIAYLVLLGLAFGLKRILPGAKDTGAAAVTPDNLSTAGTAHAKDGGMGIHLDWPAALTLLAALVVMASILAVSLTQSYLKYDDIIIWAVKGYGIAERGTLYAGQDLGGHGLAYPLNYSLMVTLFKLADGDVIPGSKFQNPLYLGSLLVVAYYFLRRWQVNALLAAAGVLFIPTLVEIFKYASFGFSNITFTANLVMGSLWTIDGLQSHQPRNILMGGVLLGFAGWTRSEGLFFAVLILAALAAARIILRQKPYLSWWSIPPLALIPGVWTLFSNRYIAGDQVGNVLRIIVKEFIQGRIDLTPIKITLDYWGHRLLNWDAWGLIVPVLLAAFLGSLFLILYLRVRKHRPGGSPLSVQILFVALVCIAMPVWLFFVAYPSEGPAFEVFLANLMDRTSFPAVISVIVLALTLLGQAEDRLVNPPQPETVSQVKQLETQH